MTKSRKSVHRAAIISVITVASLLMSCQSQKITQDEIKDFVDQFEGTAAFLNRMIALHNWQNHTEGWSDSLTDYQRFYTRLTADPQNLSRIQKYLSVVNENKYRKKLNLIYRTCLRMVIDHDPTIEKLIDSLVEIESNYEWRFEERGASLSQLQQLIATEQSRHRRQQAFEASIGLGNLLAEGLVTLVRLRNQQARKLGYNSYYDLMLLADGIDKAEYHDLLNKLESLTRDRYGHAVDSLKRALSIDDLQIWDISHAFGNTDNLEVAYLPADEQKKILKTTFNSLGFKLDAWPIYFAPSLKTDNKAAATVHPVHIPDDIRIATDIEDGTHSLERLFQQAGKAIYAAHIDSQDFLFSQAPAPCFNEGMARIMSGMIETDDWRRKYAGMPEPIVLDLAIRHEFFRLYDLRHTLVRLRFEREMYKDPFVDMNRLYSSLFEEIMMIPSRSELNPWAADLEYIVNPVRIQNTLLAECIAAQTYHYLIQKYGTVLDSDHTREILVQNFYRFGASDDWQALLARGTGERLNPQYYIEPRKD
jgi:peptidyl-dipeptidase A